MSSSKRHTVLQRGFTLVELLIVVIILGILAAVAIPQFSSSTDDAKVAALDSTLANLRSAIDLYYQQHGKYPSANASSGGTCAGGTAGATAADLPQAFLDQLTRYTDAAGHSCTVASTAYKYGPYLKKELLPKNPITDTDALAIVNTGILPLTTSSTTGGWRFDNKTGQFIADHTSYDDR